MTNGSQETFDLIFTGELVPGHDRIEVRDNLAALFKIPAEQVDKLFSSAPVTLKRNVDSEAANRYRVAVKKAGARLSTQVHQAPSAAARAAPAPQTPPARTQPPQPATQASQPAANATAADRGVPEPAATGFATSLGAQPPRPAEPRRPIDAPDLDVAPVGARLTEPTEAAPPQVVAPDWEVAAARGFLLADEERLPAAPAVDAPDFEVAPPGAPVLEGYEPLPLPELELDLSHFSVAPPGAQLGSDKPAPPPAPATDHLRLQ